MPNPHPDAPNPEREWVMVPREPTREQLKALLRHRGYDPDADESTLDRIGQLDVATMGVFVSAYRAMLAAAPVPPTVEGDDAALIAEALQACLEQAEGCWREHYGSQSESAEPHHIGLARKALAALQSRPQPTKEDVARALTKGDAIAPSVGSFAWKRQQEKVAAIMALFGREHART